MDSKILTVEEHIENTLSIIKEYFQTASTIILDLELNTKIPATKLAQNIEEVHNLKASFYPTLLFLTRGNYPGVTIKRGAHGGVYRTAEVTPKEIEDHIDKSLNDIRSIYISASNKINELNTGEKLVATKLGIDLATEFSLSGSFYPTLLFLTKDNYPGILVKRGAFGGIYKM